LDHNIDVLIPMGLSVELGASNLRRFLDQRNRLPFALTIHASVEQNSTQNDTLDVETNHKSLVRVISDSGLSKNDEELREVNEVIEESPATTPPLENGFDGLSEKSEEAEHEHELDVEEVIEAEEAIDEEANEAEDEVFEKLSPVDDGQVDMSNRVMIPTDVTRRGSLIADGHPAGRRHPNARRVSSYQ
jgi:hypothetical protein